MSDKIVAFYRGWDHFERASGGPNIIDFSLTGKALREPFKHRSDILIAASRLLDELLGNDLEIEFLRTRLIGSHAYLRALMGDQIPFETYIQETLGITPQPFSTEVITEARNEVKHWLGYYGLELRPADRERYEKLFFIHDPELIKSGILEHKDLWLDRLRESGITVPEKLLLRVEFAKVDEYWSNWINGSDENGIVLTINLHSRKRYDRGKPLTLCLHEICGHAVQMSNWKHRIDSGTLSEACGITNVHSPEAFIAEGLAQTVPDLLSDWNFPNEFHLSRALQRYRLVILHNAQMMLYRGTPGLDVLAYAHSELPFSSHYGLEADIRDRGTNPLFRSYQLSYAASEVAIRSKIAKFSQIERINFFRKMYDFPVTPHQMSLTSI